MVMRDFVPPELSAYELLTGWGNIRGARVLRRSKRGCQYRRTLGLPRRTSDQTSRGCRHPARRRRGADGPGARDAKGLMTIWSANAPPATASA
jgi:hypothetical protein